MESITKFIKSNFIALILGSFFFVLYLTFTFTGNRICDCESTENYNPGATRSGRPAMHFYHK